LTKRNFANYMLRGSDSTPLVTGVVATPTVSRPPTCKNSTSVSHFTSPRVRTIISRALPTGTHPSVAADCSEVTAFCWVSVSTKPRACVARGHPLMAFSIYYRNKCGEITLLRASPASSPQSTFSLSTRCRRSDEVI
jgi:hypothetical protein